MKKKPSLDKCKECRNLPALAEYVNGTWNDPPPQFQYKKVNKKDARLTYVSDLTMGDIRQLLLDKQLTDRELAIMTLLTIGMSKEHIANLLNISRPYVSQITYGLSVSFST